MARSVRWLACLAAVLLLPRCGGNGGSSASGGSGNTDYGVVVNAVPGLPDDFIKGVDVSMLAQIEESGGKFYDESGKEKDCLRILKDHGVNWVRLRLWNHPVVQYAFTAGGLQLEPGDYPGGKNDAARDLALAVRAKALGLKVLLDFHYSDWWADPGKQFVPQSWTHDASGKAYTPTVDELKADVYGFTKQVLTDLVAAGVAPDMVQVGNEVRAGMLWPAGAIGSGDGAYDDFAALLSAGAKAVREVDPRIRVMIHLDKGGTNSVFRTLFAALLSQGVDFDVIGLSFYPYWHGTLVEVADNMNDVSAYFGKPVVIAETAWPWTTDDADAEANSFSGAGASTYGYLASVQGQATFLRDLMQAVNDVPDGRGLGMFYWEPEWIPVAGAGWYSRGGDGWDNQTLFDHSGKALASLNVFRAVSEDRAPVTATAVSVEAQGAIAVNVGASHLDLPPSAGVVYSDGSVHPMFLVWDDYDPALLASAGSFEVKGRVAGTALPVTVPVTVAAVARNLLGNAGFEDGAGQTAWSLSNAAPAASGIGDVRTGNYALHWYDKSALTWTATQTVGGLESGKTYQLSFYAIGEGETVDATVTCGSSSYTGSATVVNWGGGWVQGKVAGISSATGSCEVKLSCSFGAGGWGSVDDASFTAE